MKRKSASIAAVNEFSGTTKVQRDIWIKAFWQYLDDHPEVGQIVRHWQKAGCDPQDIAISIHRYTIGVSSKINAARKERGKKTKKTLVAGVRSLRDLEALYRSSGQAEPANRVANEATFAENLLSRTKTAFGTKRLGVSRPWSDLAMIEGFVFEATQQRPTPRELISLIRAGREAAGQKVNPWEMDPANIRKGLKNFKKNNPLQSWLWTNPSRPI